MDYTVQEILQFVEENDVKFVRLAFCDMFGSLKNIAIMAGELPRAFADGISFDASAVEGFMNVEESDLFLFPDPSTMAILPWRPQQGRVLRFYCDIRHPDGRTFDGDGRALLRRAVADLEQAGYRCQIGAECEFYLFETDEHQNPTGTPHDRAGYFDTAPMDRGENIRREICLTMEEMGLRPESSHHEQGPGQNEVDFAYTGALTAADNLVTFKSLVRVLAAQNGLYASFMPKPLKKYSGSGLHVNMSLQKDGQNIFVPAGQGHSPQAESFIAGILDRIAEITLFCNPLTNSYRRLGAFEAPKYISWSHQNRSQLIRIPAAQGEKARMELRSPDPSCNPYVVFALLIWAGLEGIVQQKPLGAPLDLNTYSADKAALSGVQPLPDSLGRALQLAQQSDFVREHLPARMIRQMVDAKRRSWEGCTSAEDRDRYERDRYFYYI